MTLNEFYQTYSSDTTAGSANQNVNDFKTAEKRVGRCWYKLSHGGEHYSLLFSNQIDSTFSDGKDSWANIICDDWTINRVRVGLVDKVGDIPAEWITVTFDGKTEKAVSGAEPFFTDPITLNARGGEFLSYEITFTGVRVPAHYEVNLFTTIEPAVKTDTEECGRIPLPLMIGSDRKVSRKIGFLGDSITQGIGTPYDSYEHWVAEIANHLPDEWSVWDLGIGFARGQDAASDMGWLARAKQCDVVNVCFGVNDLFQGRTAAQIKADLKTIITKLKEAGCRVILFSVPPFNFEDELLAAWRDINEEILHGALGKLADKTFEFGKGTVRPAPEDNYCLYGSHPNSEGCYIIAHHYLDEGILD